MRHLFDEVIFITTQYRELLDILLLRERQLDPWKNYFQRRVSFNNRTFSRL